MLFNVGNYKLKCVKRLLMINSDKSVTSQSKLKKYLYPFQILKNNCLLPFDFLYNYIGNYSKFRNQFTISSKYSDMVCYLKRETYSGPISFEVQ